MSADLQVTGQIVGGPGTLKPFTAGITGAQRVADAHGKYFEAVRNGNAYKISVAAGAATAYVGGAAGTPLLAVHNPSGSGIYVNVLLAGVSSNVASTLAGTVSFALWGGPSVLPTGTATAATNLLSLAAGGSKAVAFSNIAPSFFDVGGAVLLAPGNQVALGGSAALTTATYSASIIWEEITYL